jgi:hypothetical protein
VAAVAVVPASALASVPALVDWDCATAWVRDGRWRPKTAAIDPRFMRDCSLRRTRRVEPYAHKMVKIAFSMFRQ